MTDTPSPPAQGVPPAADRVQALLSRAVEEQVSEQRAVSTILAQLQQQVQGLAEVLRHTAADTSIERLGGLVSNVVADLRTSTSLLGQRIEALSKRVEQVAVDAAAPSQAAATQIGAMSDALGGMANAMQQLGSFPAALAALQKDVAGLHDRLQPLAELRATVAELGVGGGDSGGGGPRLDAIEAKLDELAQAVRPERVRDSVVDAIAGRLAKLEEAAARPVVGPEVMRSVLGDFRASLDASTAERNEELVAAISAIENRLGQVGQRIADIGDAAGAVPGLATDMTTLSAKLNDLAGLSEGLATVAEGVQALQDKDSAEGVNADLAALRDDIAGLSARVTAAAGPGAEDLANAVSLRIADRLVEALAPRIADVVLTRVSGALVGQLGEALSPRLQADTEALVRNSVNESERRVLAHLDEAVLALAEALLRRGKPRPPGAPRLARTTSEQAEEADPGPSGKHAKGDESEAGWEQADYDVQGIVDRLNAAPATPEPEDVSPRPPVTLAELPPLTGAVTTSLAPSSLLSPVPAKAPVKAPTKEPAAKAPAKKAPAKAPVKKAAAKAPAKKAAAKASVAKVAQSRSAAARAVKAPARALPSPRKPTPAVKATGRPLVERTPDLPVDDIEPVRQAPAAPPRGLGRPTPAARQAAAAYRPDAPKPIQRPQPPQRPDAPPVLRGPAGSKRKPWWKPGG